MKFLLRSEVKMRDPIRNYAKKRIYCPYCKETQIKKLQENRNFTEYQCWNKNCEKKNIPFFLINDYIQNENTFDKRCGTCNEHYIRKFIENGENKSQLMFKCINHECDESNYKILFDLKSREWEKSDTLSDTEDQYIIWYLYRKPAKKEFEMIHSYLEEQGFTYIKEYEEKNTIDYRKFLENKVTFHFKLSAKNWGFGISCHKNIEIHTKATFDYQTLKILSGLYLKLKKEKSGKCFLLPREKYKYGTFRKTKFNKINNLQEI